MNHLEARALFRRTAPADIGPRAALLVQAIAWHESGYGGHWAKTCPALVGAHNLGGVHGSPGFLCPDRNAKGEPYKVNFRAYVSDEAGAADIWRILWRTDLVRRVLRDDAIDPSSLARAMSKAGYFEASEASYRVALTRAIKTIQEGTKSS